MDNDNPGSRENLSGGASIILDLLDKVYFACHHHQRGEIAKKIQDLMIEILLVESCKIKNASANIPHYPLRTL